jgi:glutamine synthetase
MVTVRTTPLALDAYVSEKSTELFTKTNIFSKREMDARHEILLESYYKKLQIEARVMGEMTNSMIIPAAISYQNVLIENIKGLKEIGLAKEAIAAPLEIINKLSNHLNIVKTNIDAMLEERKVANAIEDTREKAIAYDNNVKSYFDTIRYHTDKLEQIVDDNQWPLPKFRELLFSK